MAHKDVTYPISVEVAQVLIREGAAIVRGSDGVTRRKRTPHSGVKILHVQRRNTASLLMRWKDATGKWCQESLTKLGIDNYEDATKYAMAKAEALHGSSDPTNA